MFEDLIKNNPEIRELDLSGNPLAYPYFPENLSELKNLQVLDLTRIQFDDLNFIASILASLPSLIDLQLNLSSQNEALLILENLPKLQYLNGKSTKEETHLVDIEDSEVEEFSLSLEINSFNEVYKNIFQIFQKNNDELAKQFQEEFHNLLKEEISSINQSVGNTPNYIYGINFVNSKIKIYNYFLNTLLEKADNFDSNSIALIKSLNNKIKTNSDQMYEIVQKLYPKINERTDSLKKQLDEALKGAQVVDEEIRGFEEKIALSNKERDYVIMQTQEEKQTLMSKIDVLEKENKIMTEKLINNAKMLISNNEKQPLESHINNLGLVPKKLEEINPELNKSSSGKNIQNSSKGGYADLSQDINKSKVNDLNNSQLVVSSRVLTAKMLREMIDDIYNSKVNYDVKCRENEMMRETMEQHMYSYLNQKYGLKVSLLFDYNLLYFT